MKNSILVLIGLFVIALAGVYLSTDSTKTDSGELVGKESSPLNTTYTIDGEVVTLVDGMSEKEVAPNSATKSVVTFFGEPEYGDLDRDGDEDAVIILVHNPGGSGTYYYAAIAANVNGEYKGTDTILLGDRIAPQTYYVQDERAKINYAVRNEGESFAIQPSVGKSLHLQLDEENLRLIQVEVDFEGEANPDIMTLDMHTWKWIKTTYNNDTVVTPNSADAFTLTLREDGTFSATTDCNTVGGAYTTEGNKIFFGNMMSTLMYCEGSQEGVFTKLIREEIGSYFFTSRGELIFDLKFDSGTAVFR